MKKLAFSYEMKLKFTANITDHHFMLRCSPVSGGRQKIYSLSVDIRPDTAVSSFSDGFGNLVYTGVIAPEHSEFGYAARGIAFVDGRAGRSRDYLPCFAQQTATTSQGPQLEAFCRELGASGPLGKHDGGNLEKAVFLSGELSRCFKYEQHVTSVDTTAEEAFSMCSGVCQDFSHILLSLCRRWGIPARYISGLLLGEGESHSWVEVFSGGEWHGYDPTHNRPVVEDHIRISCGRDYSDCIVNKGVFKGNAIQEQQVIVKVIEL